MVPPVALLVATHPLALGALVGALIATLVCAAFALCRPAVATSEQVNELADMLEDIVAMRLPPPDAIPTSLWVPRQLATMTLSASRARTRAHRRQHASNGRATAVAVPPSGQGETCAARL